MTSLFESQKEKYLLADWAPLSHSRENDHYFYGQQIWFQVAIRLNEMIADQGFIFPGAISCFIHKLCELWVCQEFLRFIWLCKNAIMGSLGRWETASFAHCHSRGQKYILALWQTTIQTEEDFVSVDRLDCRRHPPHSKPIISWFYSYNFMANAIIFKQNSSSWSSWEREATTIFVLSSWIRVLTQIKGY